MTDIQWRRQDCGNDMHWDPRILEIWKRNIVLDEPPQIGGIDQIVPRALLNKAF